MLGVVTLSFLCKAFDSDDRSSATQCSLVLADIPARQHDSANLLGAGFINST